MKVNPTHNVLTIWVFMWGIIKPYKWWYILILQAPVVSAFYLFANNYSLKLLIDAFSIEPLSYSHLLYPIGLFIGAQISLESAWRIYNFAVWKTQPFVQRKLLLNVYDYVQYHSYNYFQNTPSGTLLAIDCFSFPSILIEINIVPSLIRDNEIIGKNKSFYGYHKYHFHHFFKEKLLKIRS